jgi:hypothetical protein
MSPVTSLVPPYLEAEPWLGDPPPLGSIALCRADLASGVARFHSLLQSAPWCLPCVITTPTTGDPEIMTGIYELVGQLAFVPDPLREELIPPLAVAAAKTRPVPTGAILADYVVQRTGNAELRRELKAVLEPADPTPIDESVPERTLRDRLRRLGPLTVRCWRTVATLSRLAARMDNVPVETLAHRAGVEARTLRAWTMSYLRIKLRAFRIQVGWEWVLEAALRHAGMVQPAGTSSRHPSPSESRWSRTELPRSRHHHHHRVRPRAAS